MDRVPQFKVDGDLVLTVPLQPGFGKVLYEFVRLAVSKSGFDAEESKRIAASVSTLVVDKAQRAGKESPGHLRLCVAHRRGSVSIKTTIQELHFSQEEKFQTQAS